jgi:hypothetical protein
MKNEKLKSKRLVRQPIHTKARRMEIKNAVNFGID